jgi:hypothetical protein
VRFGGLLVPPGRLDAISWRCRRTVELYAAGYLLRRISDAGKPARAEYQYRLNPDAAQHAHALLDA